MPKLQNVAQTSQFLVKFVLPRGDCRRFLRQKGINDRFIADNVGLLCSDAVLPGSAMATLNTAGDYQGLIERFAHTRNFTQVNFDFYVDNEYKSLKFLEHWMEFISSGAIADPSSDTYHFKMKYPDEYKSNDTRVVKFERNHSQFLEYRFIGMFPLSLNSTRVSYQNSQVLKATATFSFDRYICGESNSLARALGLDFNNQPARDARASARQTERNNNTLSRIMNDDLALLNENTGYRNLPVNLVQGGITRRFGTNTTTYQSTDYQS
jgi:hypothetical protein